MTPIIVFSVIASYFAVLILVSFLTGRKSDSSSFFTGNKKSPWFLVAFGMIGASLSGVTFISVPGEVGTSEFKYFQMVLGYLVGYFVIANVLLPLYYKMNLVSIYTYLEKRFGVLSYKTGAFFFLISRVIGAAFRLFLVAGVLQIGFFNAFEIPFSVTVLTTLGLIWLYTFKAGIKTIVWTDTLQTFFMLSSAVISIFLIAGELNLSWSETIDTVVKSPMSQIFEWDINIGNNFYKQFLAGAFLAIVMTGLDQDMMQKNLTCRNLKDAKKNMLWFSVTLVPVNLLFLSLGVLLYVYAAHHGIEIPERTDKLYPQLALNNFSIFAGVVFLLGITAAAFSSADSALTALTTSFSVDFLGIKPDDATKKTKVKKNIIHAGFSFIVFLTIMLFYSFNSDSVVTAVFKAAAYTYGPLLGLFAFGIFSKRKTLDRAVPFIAVLSPILCYFLNVYSYLIFDEYKFGLELLIINGGLTFLGLLIFSEDEKVAKG